MSKKTSLRTTLLRAAAFGTIAAAAWAPGQAAAQDDCVISGNSAECSGDQGDGRRFTDGSIVSLNVFDLTAPVDAPVLLGLGLPAFGVTYTGIAFDPLTITLDDSVVINAGGLLNSGVRVGGTGQDGGALLPGVGPNVFIESAAAVNFNSFLSQTTRAAARDEAWRITRLGHLLELGEAAKLAIENGDFSAEANAAVKEFQCRVYLGDLCDSLPISLLEEFFGLPETPNRETLQPSVYDFISFNTAEYAYWTAPPAPEELVIMQSAIGGFSLGVPSSNGRGGLVSIVNTGTVTTEGANALGIWAQSQGGNSSIGDGGEIYVRNDGSITTSGASSVGIFARSLGGFVQHGEPGGHIFIEGVGTIHTEGTSAYGIYALSQGGRGNDDTHFFGGDGGHAEVSYGGDISTTNNYATGIVALSIGGVGFLGDSANGPDGPAGDSANTGGHGGDGGLVTVNLLEGGSIWTRGYSAPGISATSRGGYGGKGGNGNNAHGPGVGGIGGSADAVYVGNAGEILTEGDASYGIFAQSLASAGGRGGNSDTIFWGTGANGGPAGRGGSVEVNNTGMIETGGRRAFGIFAQSLGGEGGAGGDGSGFLSSDGGDGGTADSTRCTAEEICPDGGAILVLNDVNAEIHTGGYGAHAILAQSIGGGGGQGGDADGWLHVSGGGGGRAGNGGTVGVRNAGLITAEGYTASGIFAQSIGGGGGAGGDAVATGIFAAVAIGGRGGAGGDGKAVTATNEGTIITTGERSSAIFAQSIGGGGGSGGSATAISAGPIASASVAIGGDGSVGGRGDLVDVDNSGDIAVWGDFSTGIFAQSVGGGGGQGGMGFAFSAAIGDKAAVAASVAIGGKGGPGETGGVVLVDNSGSIITHDFNSIGIFAQSVGGGGGNGGASMAQSVTATASKGVEFNISIAVGGKGGNGAEGGNVTVTNGGSVATLGDGSTGIFAQSVGGGGGQGGDASTTSTAFSAAETTKVAINVSVGGDGGEGLHGGEVKVTNTGEVITLGQMANGITAQSVGGGGGNGGSGEQGSLFEDFDIPTELPDVGDGDESELERRNARNRFAGLRQDARSAPSTSGSHGRRGKKGGGSSSSPQSYSLDFSIGGTGGAAGNGRLVEVNNYGAITTGGFFSIGVFAQSVGGGGGSGGAGAGEATGDIGLAGGIGGRGGVGGTGGTVTVNNFGAITTLQALSYGILAQSVGGGGGVGGLGSGQHESQTSFSLGLGGEGGSGNYGGAVETHQTGNVLTFGAGAIGVFAQSVGGGGGVGGGAEEATFGSINLGGYGGAGGDGGIVFVEVDGNIATEGVNAHGVMAQSVGGGGGVGGNIETRTIKFGIDPFGLIEIDTGIALSVGNLSAAGEGGSGGNGMGVTVETTGTISTFGRSAHGIFAQSVGGGGGAGGAADTGPLGLGFAGSSGGTGTAGTVNITHDGDIHAYGENAVGIFAQSMGGVNVNYVGGNIVITLNGGDVHGGGGAAGAGILLSGGNTNTLTNNGGLISALSGIAIVGTDGNDHVINRGRIEGSVGLGGGVNSFVNEATGVYASGAGVFVGGAMYNHGDLSPYGVGVAGTTAFAGNYIQSGAGSRFTVDVNFNGPSDLVTVDGAATLGGVIHPVFVHARDLENAYVTVLSADSITASGISADVADTLVVDYLTRITGGNLEIGVAIDYNIDSISERQQGIAGHIQSIWEAGSPAELDALMDHLAHTNDEAEYRAVLDGLHPFSSFKEGAGALLSNTSFLDGLMSCPDAVLRETSCVWVRAGQRDADQEAWNGDPGYSLESSRYQGGAQFETRPGWFAGISLGYEEGEFIAPGQAMSQSETLILGGVLKRETGDWTFSGAVDYARVTYDRSRQITFPTATTVTSDSEDNVLALRLRASRLWDRDVFYAKARIDLDGYAIRTGAFSESGGGVLGLDVAESEQYIGAAEVAVEVGGNFQLGGGALRPFVGFGAAAFTADSLDVDVRFQGAPAAADDFTVSSLLPPSLARANVGVDWSFGNGSLRFELEHRNGDGYEDNAATGKLRFAF